MLVADLTSQIYSMERTAGICLFKRTDSSWVIHERQWFVLYVELPRFLRHQINNGPATVSI